jgi:hypothetical protein
MKYNDRYHHTMIGYRKVLSQATPSLKVVFGYKAAPFVYDEYLASYYTTNRPLATALPFREIRATVITHEIGDSESDYQLDKVIVDMQYDSSRYGFYTYEPLYPDPVVYVDARSKIYANDTPTSVIDLVSRNQSVMPSINPFVSVRQAPGDTNVSANDVNVHRESIALVTPMLKFRRSRYQIISLQKVSTIRSLQVMMTEYPRRTWG